MKINNRDKYLNSEFVKDYDKTIDSLIPHYREMLLMTVDTLPFSINDRLKICEYGIGTGNMTELILKKYLNSTIDGYDISPFLLEIAKKRLSGYGRRVAIYQKDITNINFKNKYDLIISTLFFHEINVRKRLKLLEKSIQYLSGRGVLMIADFMSAGSNNLNKIYFALWYKHMVKSKISCEKAKLEVDMHRVEKYTYKKYIDLMQVKYNMKTDIVWKYLNFYILRIK